jgi:hypothetical protein
LYSYSEADVEAAGVEEVGEAKEARATTRPKEAATT